MGIYPYRKDYNDYADLILNLYNFERTVLQDGSYGTVDDSLSPIAKKFFHNSTNRNLNFFSYITIK